MEQQCAPTYNGQSGGVNQCEQKEKGKGTGTINPTMKKRHKPSVFLVDLTVITDISAVSSQQIKSTDHQNHKMVLP